jgi:hypothetical protein
MRVCRTDFGSKAEFLQLTRRRAKEEVWSDLLMKSAEQVPRRDL